MMQASVGSSQDRGAQALKLDAISVAPKAVVNRVESIHQMFPGLAQEDAAEVFERQLGCAGLVRVGDTILKLPTGGAAAAPGSTNGSDGPVWISLKGLNKAFSHFDHSQQTTDLYAVSGR